MLGLRISGMTMHSVARQAPLVMLLALTVLALARPIIGYDSWMYHLPFSSYLWSIGGGRSGFAIDPFIEQRWLGFPKLWEFIQGFFWYATAWLNAVIIPQLLLCLAYFYYARRALGIPGRYLTLAFFASPMLLIHFECTYLDLPTGIAAALAFLILTGLVANARRDAPWRFWAPASCVVVLFGLAGNIKYQGLLACLAVAVVIGGECLLIRRVSVFRRIALLALLAVATLAAGATVTRNLLRFHDPFYPLQVRVAGTMVFDGPEDPTRDADYPAYLLYGSTAVRFPEPINFILSATELDWTMRGVAPWYNIDSVTGKSPRRGPESRAGGWGGLFVLVNFWLLAVQLLRPRLLSDSRQRLLAVNALLITAATACLPRAHELRYWLFVPLILIPVNLRFLCAADAERRFMPQMLAAMMLYGMATAVLSPKSGLLEPRLVTQHNRRMDVPQAVRQALDTTGRYCNPLDELLFRYSPGATGLQGLVSRNARDCP